jgi:hypothetical protein
MAWEPGPNHTDPERAVPCSPPSPPGQTLRPLFDSTDWLLATGLAALGLGLRLAWFSGWGLGDDPILYGNIKMILTSGHLTGDNQSYRFPWWLATATSARLFGLTENALILPVTMASVAGIVTTYAIGRTLWGRAAAIIAALLIVVHPLDFTWSTMFTSDVFCSLFSATTMLLLLRAIALDEPLRRRRAWWLAACSWWLAVYAKLTGALLAPAIGLILWANRRRVDRTFASFLGALVLLFGASALVTWTFTGSLLFPLESELKFQGLRDADALVRHGVTREMLLLYPQMLLGPDWFGHWLFSLHGPLVLALALAAPLAGLTTPWPAVWWFAFLFLGMEFNIQRVPGGWVSGFRNVRHMHALVYPLALALTGYLTALRERWSRTIWMGVAALLAFGFWQSVAVAELTHVSFSDVRTACRFLAKLPPGPVLSDFQLETGCSLYTMPGFSWPRLEPDRREVRVSQIRAVPEGYLVTGGGRLPWYGCIHCIPLADEVDPAQWELLLERPGPVDPRWRPDVLRIWRRRTVARASDKVG